MAIARGLPAAAGYMELCTGTGAVTVAVDAQGEPTGPSHLCPECALAVMDNVETAPAVLVPIKRFSQKLAWTSASPPYSSVTFSLHARGPPALI
ncbi:hypothetical protein [Cognatishimia sp. WU-CL00825]|uniref:hypothetical protein n=1 Tax=Cognatishimia sp. WU-CL00825 TaxID=3127658 RepID=UPI00336583CD